MKATTNHKPKSSYLLPLLMLLLTFLSISIPTLTVQATAAGSAGNGDGQSTNTEDLGEHHNEGYPSWGKTGWLVYLTDTSGSLCSDVVFISATSNFPTSAYNGTYLTTRIGNSGISSVYTANAAEWGAPFTDGGSARGYEIKQELITGTNYSGGLNSNVDYVILKYLGEESLNLFKSSPNYYLVLETCAWHKIFTGSYQGNYAVASASGWSRLQQDSGMNSQGDEYTGWMDNGSLQVSAYLDKDWAGLPTVPMELSVDPSNPSTYIPNSILSSNLGYGMIAIRSTTESTHTWDSPNHPSDEAPAPEPPTPSSSTPPSPTDYQYTIIKSYRLRDETGTLTDKGTYIRPNTVATITIEDEPLNTTDKNYKVIGWKTSTSSSPGISSLTWESSVPNIIGTTGSSPATTTLTKQYKVLYVLLEANVSNPEVADYNYILHESSITRRINSYKSHQLTV